MKKVFVILKLLLGLVYSVTTLAQNTAPEQKMSVTDRLQKARTVKAEKKVEKSMTRPDLNAQQSNARGDRPAARLEKAMPADYKSPVDKVRKGPNGEVVRTGERGAKYYVNKNGNKTYLSSNQ